MALQNRVETLIMLRTIFGVGILALIGLFLLKLVFGILPWLFAILFSLLLLALKIAVVGLVVYFVLRIISPDTARRMREKFSGTH
jgi:hypothetical protein